MIRMIAVALALGVFAAASAQAQSSQPRTVDNPLVAALGRPVLISDVEIRYPDDAFGGFLDRPSGRLVDQLTPEQRQGLSESAGARGLSPETMAERLSEYLTRVDLRAMSPPPRTENERRYRLSVVVNRIRFRGMIASAMAPTPPSADMTFTLYGPDNAVTAEGSLDYCASWAWNIEAAQRRHGIRFNWSGTDTNLRMMVGLTNAIATCAYALVSAPSFSTQRVEIASAPFPIYDEAPVYTVRMAPTRPSATPPSAPAQN